MEIAHTLAVDGYITANSEALDTSTTPNGASGGAGGSIWITTHNFTGIIQHFMAVKWHFKYLY